MKILALGPHTDLLPLVELDMQPIRLDEPLSLQFLSDVCPGAIVSFGYKHVITPEVISNFGGVIMNLHISLLPWNRGYHPNFWAWLENSPHGITIHRVDEGIDTGPIYSQRPVSLSDRISLRQSHSLLHDAMVTMFTQDAWHILDGSRHPVSQARGGSTHKSADIKEFEECLPRGWDTECALVREYGREKGLWVQGPPK